MLIFSTERAASSSLNESPPEKEGKSCAVEIAGARFEPQ